MNSCRFAQVSSFIKANLNPISWRVKRAIEHDTQSFTQGLCVVGNTIYEAHGRRGESGVLVSRLGDGRPLERLQAPLHMFGEGLVVIGNRIVQATWTDGHIIRYDRRSGKVIDTPVYGREGWGMCLLPARRVAMTHGTNIISIIDPISYRRIASVRVSLQGRPIPLLNDISHCHSFIAINIWRTNIIMVCDNSFIPRGYLDLSKLCDAKISKLDQNNVLNGIGYSRNRKSLFITGKRWSKLYEIFVNK